MVVKEVIDLLEQFAPPAYQESYDNSRLIVGDSSVQLTGVLISLDCIEEVVEEAIQKGCNLVVSHHPIVFKGVKSLTGKNYVERTLIKAIKNDICLYAIHTNLDNVCHGVNKKISDLLGLTRTKVLAPKQGVLTKLVTFIPEANTEEVLSRLYEAGAGQIGNYDHCSFRTSGEGSFRPNEAATPAIGERGKEERVTEHRVEVVFPSHITSQVLKALKSNHPYEEVAYYLTELVNQNQEVGSGMVGELAKSMDIVNFMKLVKEKFNVKMIRHTAIVKDEVRRIAVCGGSGSFLLGVAKANKADVFITADFKYHEFFDAEEDIVVLDIGHYESEQFTKDLIFNYLKEKIANIALNLSEANTNPINYL